MKEKCMTVAELANILQSLAHEGHAEDDVMIGLYDGMYDIKNVTEYGFRLDFKRLGQVKIFTINAEPVSNE